MKDRLNVPETFLKFSRYVLIRVVTLFITVAIGVYITIVITNMGGHVDEIRKNELTFQFGGNQAAVEAELKRIGADRPFLIRSFSYLADAMLLDLGRSHFISSNTGSRKVSTILLERLPPTIVLFATAQLFLFIISILVALTLSRHYHTLFDKIVVALAPTSAGPPWFYGIFLILIFASLLQVLPYGNMVSAPSPKDPTMYALSVLEHMILPVGAILLGSLFVTIYYWRSFFLIYSTEDYVDLARAKGLPTRVIEQKYILRPTLPTIVTSFALTMITVWTGSILLEIVFNWPGLGQTLFEAIGALDLPIIIGSVVIYAYLLALTVLFLDVFYALIDPRVKVGSGGGAKA